MKSFLPALALFACSKAEPQPREASGSDGKQAPVPVRRHDAISRSDFNRWAVRLNLPVYWIEDTDDDHAIDADEVATLLFYPTTGTWRDGDRLTRDFEAAYDRIVAASRAAPPPTDGDGRRRALVARDLDQGRATLVRTDLSAASAEDKAFVARMMKVASLLDDLYATQTGAKALASRVPTDPASQSLFRRNRGPRCVAPATEHDPLCSAIPGAPKLVSDLYPAALQTDPDFCDVLEKHPRSKELMSPFTVVRGERANLTAVSYAEAYKPQMTAIARSLDSAADAIKDPAEQPLVAYLRAAARGFETNAWDAADEAWANMTVDNSKWYVRIAPDETYWEPCNHKAGMHLTFARINEGSRTWQAKLVPIQQDMEKAVAARAGAPYQERTVSFHLPDFIDIVINAGEDRAPLGATNGQSLPNWGPVVAAGRGRTIAMVNLYTDADSRAARLAQAQSVLDDVTMKSYARTPEPGLLSTILHEATHNLGPAHEYRVGNKTGPEIFTGSLASVLEELKAQAGALFLVEMLRDRKLITNEMAAQTYVDTVVWAFGHVSQGMYEGDKTRKTYSQVGAIQNGFLIDRGALVWDPQAAAANGKDTGAFRIEPSKIVSACDELMKTVAGIMARGDRPAAEALLAKYVDGMEVVPHAVIRERFLRFPKASFVYAVTM